MQILVQHENTDLSLYDHWEPVTAADVQTPQEVYAELNCEGPRSRVSALNRGRVPLLSRQQGLERISWHKEESGARLLAGLLGELRA